MWNLKTVSSKRQIVARKWRKLWSGFSSGITQDQFEVAQGLRSARNDSVYPCLNFRGYVLQASHLLQFSFQITKTTWGHWESCWKTGYYIYFSWSANIRVNSNSQIKEGELEVHLGIGLSEAYARGAFDVRYNVCQWYFGGTFLKINTTAPTQKKSKI